jgi:hypothetical protein
VHAQIAAEHRQRGRQGRRRVDHEQVARIEQLGELGEAGVLELPGRAARNQEADVVASSAPDLGGRARLGGLRRSGDHRAAPASELAA